MRTQHLENVLRFLELFTNNCENRTQKYTAHDCILQVKKYCTTCYDAIQCLAKYKNELTQLYKWNILTYYCLLHYYDFIESATVLLKYRLKHPLCSSDADNFSDLKRESRQLSYFNALKDSSVLYYVKALKEESSALYRAKALKCHTYIRGARLKSKINPVYGEQVSERPEKQGGGISESPINLFSNDVIKAVIHDYVKAYADKMVSFDNMSEKYYKLLTDSELTWDREWCEFKENKYDRFSFKVRTGKDDEYLLMHTSFVAALRYVLMNYDIPSIFSDAISIECWFESSKHSAEVLSLDIDELMLLKYLHSERLEREVKEVEHHDSY